LAGDPVPSIGRRQILLPRPPAEPDGRNPGVPTISRWPGAEIVGWVPLILGAPSARRCALRALRGRGFFASDAYATAAVRRRLPFTQRTPMIAAAPAGTRRSGKPSGVLALTMLKHAGPDWSALLIACVALWSSA